VHSSASRKTPATARGHAARESALPASIERALAIPAHQRAGTIEDVEHIVVLMQENRAFDHYFGTLRGVRGFGDPRVMALPSGRPVWYQPDGSGFLLPFHPTAPDFGLAFLEDTPLLVPGCDRPQPLPHVDGLGRQRRPGRRPRHQQRRGRLRLDAAGFWGWTEDPYIGNYGDNSLLYFHQYQNAKPGEPLYERARRGTNIAVPGTPFAALFGDLRDDVRRNRLPQVSWIVAPEAFSEHGNWPPNYGAWYVSQVLDALTSNREVWSKRDLAVEQGRLVDPRLREAQRRPGGAAGYLGLRAARSRAAPRLRPDAAGAAGAARAGARAAVRPRAALRAAGRRLHARRRQRVPDRLRQHGRGRRDTVVRDLRAGESFRPRRWLGKSFGASDPAIRTA